jgi:hypothetical protein
MKKWRMSEEIVNESSLPESIINAAGLTIPRAQGQQQGL